MKRYYRNRIMLSAMLSFLIILIIAVAGIWLFSYQRIERETDSFIAFRLEPREEREKTDRFSQDAPPAMFGYTPGRRNIPSGFFAPFSLLFPRPSGFHRSRRISPRCPLRRTGLPAER